MPPHTCFEPNCCRESFAAEHEACQAPLSKGPMTPRKSVSFSEKVQVRKTPHFSDYSDDEIQACWYQENELRRIKIDVHFEVDLLENDCLDDGSIKYCSRGLGHYTTLGAKQRTTNKMRVQTFVLGEQALQREEGSNDPEYIAEIYTAYASTFTRS